ncbi:MAG: hypothetical protein V3T01_06470 [Myxococcota bacterium]
MPYLRLKWKRVDGSRPGVGLGLFGALLFLSLLASAPQANAEKARDVAAVSRIAARAGVDVTVLGQPSRARLPHFSETPDPLVALAFLRGKHFDRVEVYGGGGELEKLVSVARDSSGAAASRSRSSAAARRSTDSLSDALVVARDRSASRAERQRAIGVLSRSGSEAAVNALREIIVEDEGPLSTLAISALRGFAGTGAGGAAEEVIAGLRDQGIGDPLELASAQAAHDLSPLIAEFAEISNSHLRKQFMHAVARTGSGPDFIDFMLAALGDESVTIRNAAVIQAMRSEDLLTSQAITQALENAVSDPMRRVRAAAAKALFYRENRLAIEAEKQAGEAPISPIDDNPRVDENPIVPGA